MTHNLRRRHCCPIVDAVQSSAVTVSQAGAKAINLETVTARLAPFAADLQATGTISYPADQTVKISPRLSGRVRQVFVRVGDRVTAGQTLALLDSVGCGRRAEHPPPERQQTASGPLDTGAHERLYKLGTPDVTAAQANLDQARARRGTRSALDRVKEQARIGGFTEKPVEDAQTAVVGARSDLAQAQADQAQAERDHDRKAKLVDIGVAAKSDLEAADNAGKGAGRGEGRQGELALRSSSWNESGKRLKPISTRIRQVRSAQSDARQAQLQQEAAEKNLRLAKTTILRDLQQARSDYQAAQADAENARHVLDCSGSPARTAP